MTTTHSPDYFLPSTADIHDAFRDEISSLGGTVTDVFDDGQHLLARAVLAHDAEVLPQDTMKPGVAIRAAGMEIQIHPYVFRKVCTNGAIMAQSFHSQRIERVESTGVAIPTFEVIGIDAEVRRVVRRCASKESFVDSTAQMRKAADVRADIALHLLPMLRRLPEHMFGHAMLEIFREFRGGGDRSVYGLMNAVTSVARNTRDREMAWRLEQVGGMIPAALEIPSPTPTHGAMAGVA